MRPSPALDLLSAHATRIPTRTRRPFYVCGTPAAGAISVICMRRSTCSLHLRCTKSHAIVKGVACYYVYAAPPSHGGDVGCPSPSLIPYQREQRQRRRFPISRATRSTPRGQQHPHASASPRRPPTTALVHPPYIVECSLRGPCAPPPRTTTTTVRSSTTARKASSCHVYAAPPTALQQALPFDATPPALIPHQREHPAPGPARQRQLADPPRTHRVDAQAPCDTAAPSRQRQCGDPSRPLPPSASARRGSSESTSSGSLPASPLRTRAPRVLSSSTLARACRRRTRSYLVLRPPPLLTMRVRSSCYHQTRTRNRTHCMAGSARIPRRARPSCALVALSLRPLVALVLAPGRGCAPHPQRCAALHSCLAPHDGGMPRCGCARGGDKVKPPRCMRPPHPPAHVEGRLHGACAGSSLDGGNYMAQRDRAGRRLHCGASCSPASPFNAPSADTTPTRAPQSATPRSPSSARRFYSTRRPPPPLVLVVNTLALVLVPVPSSIFFPRDAAALTLETLLRPGPSLHCRPRRLGLSCLYLWRQLGEGKEGGEEAEVYDHRVVDCLQLGLPTSTRAVSLRTYVVAGARAGYGVAGGWAAESESLRADPALLMQVRQNIPQVYVSVSSFFPSVPRYRCVSGSTQE
ncbi:hypothetical protein DFH09DRAFT_100215 [Mycena vulgaris]|nr:hypothetical protein DFH09DRAFT_100215 [Mycena vulgaris]